MKLSLVSLGCAKNLVDSEMILSLMRKNDFILTTEVEEADVIIVNTCGFIEDSKVEAINTIFEMVEVKKKYHNKKRLEFIEILSSLRVYS